MKKVAKNKGNATQVENTSNGVSGEIKRMLELITDRKKDPRYEKSSTNMFHVRQMACDLAATARVLSLQVGLIDSCTSGATPEEAAIQRTVKIAGRLVQSLESCADVITKLSVTAEHKWSQAEKLSKAA